MTAQTQTRQRAVVLGVAVALAVALRFYALGQQPLWLDEATTAEFAERGLLASLFAEGAHPPLFYLIEHFVVRWLGASEATLRLPSAIFGILAVPAAWAVARRLFPQQPATAPAAAVLVATSPFLIYLSQDARSYPLVILLALLSTVSFLRFCGESGDDPRRGRPADLVVYTLLSALLVYTHYYGAWVLLAHEAVYWRHCRAQRTQWLLARADVALAFLPWALWAAGQVKVGTLAWTGNAALRVPYALLRDLVGYGIAPHAAPGNDPVSVMVREEGLVVALATLPLLWLLLRGAWRTVRTAEPRTRLLLGMVLLLPLAVMVGVSPWVKLLHERAVSFQTPLLLLLVAYGWATLPAKRRRAVAAALCGAAIAFALAAYYGSPGDLLGYRLRYGKEDWRGAAAYVEQMRPEAVVLRPAYIRMAFRRYWRAPPETVPLVDVPLGAGEAYALQRLVKARRIALVISHGDDPEWQLRVYFNRTRRLAAEKFFPYQNGIWIYVYDRASDNSDKLRPRDP